MKKLKTYVEFNESYYSYLGGSTPYNDEDMRKKVIEPEFGKKYDSYIMFKDDDYNKMKKKYAKDASSWKPLYKSSTGQGRASISPDGKIISASVLDNGGIIGAVYIKK